MYTENQFQPKNKLIFFPRQLLFEHHPPYLGLRLTEPQTPPPSYPSPSLEVPDSESNLQKYQIPLKVGPKFSSYDNSLMLGKFLLQAAELLRTWSSDVGLYKRSYRDITACRQSYGAHSARCLQPRHRQVTDQTLGIKKESIILLNFIFIGDVAVALTDKHV